MIAPGGTAEVRRIQPYQALKTYVCGGCNSAIPPATGHLVIVPTEAPDLRRHWHHSCWERWGDLPGVPPG